MPSRCGAALAAVALVAIAAPCRAQEWAAAFAVREDADVVTSVGVGFGSMLSLRHSPDDAHGVGGRLRGSSSYVDDDKVSLLEVADIEYYTVYRPERDRYDSGSMPTVALFGVSSQLRVTPRFHLIYGAALSRSGVLTHAASGGLAFNLGTALPLLFRRAPTMREYRRAHLQLEVLPLVGSLLTTLMEEGFYDREHPRVQVQGEVALTGRVETLLGTVSADARLSASYVHQRSMYLRVTVHLVSPTFWRRVALTAQSQVVLPLRPMLGHLSENAQTLLYEPNVALSLGFIIYIDNLPRLLPEHAVRYRDIHERRVQRRTERRDRRAQRAERIRQRMTRPPLR